MLSTQTRQLTHDQVKEVKNVLLEACTAMELGGDWREVFRRARNRRVGRMRRIYDMLYEADIKAIDMAAQTLTEDTQ